MFDGGEGSSNGDAALSTPEWSSVQVREVSSEGMWSVSSCKAGYGVEAVVDGSTDTYWQSDGAQPHLLSVAFPRKTPLAFVALYVDFKADESYTPSRIGVRVGTQAGDLREVSQWTLDQEPSGWHTRSLVCPNSGNPIRAFMLQARDLREVDAGPGALWMAHRSLVCPISGNPIRAFMLQVGNSALVCEWGRRQAGDLREVSQWTLDQEPSGWHTRSLVGNSALVCEWGRRQAGDLREVSQWTLDQEPSGWHTRSLVCPNSGNPIRAFMLQLAVLQNHQNGRDTHIRQVKVFSPLTSSTPRFALPRPLSREVGEGEEEPYVYDPPKFTTVDMLQFSTIR